MNILLSCALLASAGVSDMFFGVDAAASWLARPDAFSRPFTNGETCCAYVVRRIDETGFRHVRERLSWGDVNPAPDTWNFSRYLNVARLYHERGIRISGMFHDAPNWMEKRGKLPTDLSRVYAFARKAAETFGDMMEDWEFWNEEDIGFCPAAAWDYAAAAKAAYLGFKDASPSRPAMMGALCHGSRGAYDKILFANDLGAYTDVFNFHTYAPLQQYPKMFGDLHAFMQEAGVGDRAVWLTESGTHQEGTSAKMGTKKGFRAHSPAQEALHAEIAAKSQFALMMQGASRDYFFCFPPYNEMGGNKDWGVMRRDGTLKPAAKVFTDMIAALGDTQILGEVDVGHAGVSAYAFRQRDGRETLAYIAKGPADAKGSVGEKDVAPDVAFSYRGLNLVATARPRFVKDLDALPIARAARPRGTIGVPPPRPDEDRRIVLQVVTNPKELVLGGGKSFVEIEGTNASVRVIAYNFDGCAKTGSLFSTVARLKGLPKVVTLPAWGKAEVTLSYDANPKCSNERVEIAGSFNRRRTSRLALQVVNMAAMKNECDIIPLDLKDDSLWIRNDSATTFETRWDAASSSRLLHFVWKRECDRWAYPRCKIPAGSLKGARLVEFEIRSEQDKVENDFSCAHIMVWNAKGNGHHLAYAAPNGSWERRRIDLTAEKNPEKIVNLSFGANPHGRDLKLFLRNVRLYRAK